MKIAGAPAGRSADTLESCRRCELWKRATQAVAGEGPPRAALMLVGEQPGDEEDRAGRPFVGPAGRLLRLLLSDAGIDPATVFLTNAVKHFRFEFRGKRRLHKTPSQVELEACNLWLRKEIERTQPHVIVTLGTTALKAVIGEKLAIVAARERTLVSPDGTRVIATYHPAAVLRAPALEQKDELRRAMLADLKRAALLAKN
ncbi:MAG TPA: UdgX family uracil-DNA binding protein [Casimicrobiaceae bacterium]|jgi:uracil-DNA glycosylase family protein|nr:UdgX family uracil-DNA binding protein [Casimicrobiaceae bacterium]